MLIIAQLLWDEWNTEHIARHGVTPSDVEEVCSGEPIARETYGGRLMVIGPNRADNLLAAILAPRGNDVYYVVTARPAAKKERRIYRELGGA